LWLDVEIFEDAYAVVQDVPGQSLEAWDVHVLEAGAATYAGPLLEGWYQDWCLCERERLHQVHLIMLDKLMSHCEQAGAYEAGLVYGEASLRCDRARERTYQHLMRLHVDRGDRTAALRQYERCRTALREELDVDPSARTQGFYEQIRQGTALRAPDGPERTGPPDGLSDRFRHILDLQHELVALQGELQREIEAVGLVLRQGQG
jgi:DNA-binding SARP family transcriptional activator